MSNIKSLIGFFIMLVVGTTAHAGSLALTLTRNSLNNVNDAAGGWQYEGGTISKSGTVIGQYTISRRTITGASSVQNTAAETVTVFFTSTAGTAPKNITLQGAHSFGDGSFVGSVSAASNTYSWIVGADSKMVYTSSGVQTLNLYWNGSSGLSLP